jgi:hypothetical protein
VNKPTIPIQDLSQTLVKGKQSTESALMNELQNKFEKKKGNVKSEQLRSWLNKE